MKLKPEKKTIQARTGLERMTSVIPGAVLWQLSHQTNWVLIMVWVVNLAVGGEDTSKYMKVHIFELRCSNIWSFKYSLEGCNAIVHFISPWILRAASCVRFFLFHSDVIIANTNEMYTEPVTGQGRKNEVQHCKDLVKKDQESHYDSATNGVA